MLTGALPFAGDTTYSIIRKHIEESPTPVEKARSDIPEWLSAVVAKALEKTPEDRFADPIHALSAIRGKNLKRESKPATPLPYWALGLPTIACCLLIVPLVAFFGAAHLFNWEVITATLVAGSITAILGACLMLLVGRWRIVRVLALLLVLTGVLGLLGIVANTGYVLSVSTGLLIGVTSLALSRRSASWV
jgi:hypothetical protein